MAEPLAESFPGLIAGFDAGQTHTTCRLAEVGSGRVVAEGQGPGVCHLAAPDGPHRFQLAMRQSLDAALGRLAAGAVHPVPSTLSAGPSSAGSEGAVDAKLPDPVATAVPLPPPLAGATPRLSGALAAAAVGASGIEIDTAVQKQGLALAAEALGLPPHRLWVGGDERTALRGAFPDGPGIVVISGTGTIAVGRDGRGREHRCAGWGWILDGAGSAFDIGRDGLALALRMADGRVPTGPLQARLWQALELDPGDPGAAQAIKARVVQPGFAPAGLAALAPVLEALAEEGEVAALELLRRHAHALAASTCGVARSLQLEAPPVATLGGAITHLQTFRALYREELSLRWPRAVLVTPAGDAASGALAIARELLGRAEVG